MKEHEIKKKNKQRDIPMIMRGVDCLHLICTKWYIILSVYRWPRCRFVWMDGELVTVETICELVFPCHLVFVVRSEFQSNFESDVVSNPSRFCPNSNRFSMLKPNTRNDAHIRQRLSSTQTNFRFNKSVCYSTHAKPAAIGYTNNRPAFPFDFSRKSFNVFFEPMKMLLVFCCVCELIGQCLSDCLLKTVCNCLLLCMHYSLDD